MQAGTFYECLQDGRDINPTQKGRLRAVLPILNILKIGLDDKWSTEYATIAELLHFSKLIIKTRQEITAGTPCLSR